MSKQTTTHALGHYRSVGAYGAAAGDRLQLILKMMDGALDRIATARGHMERQEPGPKGEAIGRAVQLIDGLRTCLDHDQGGDISGNLEALYDYMMRRLTEANLTNEAKMLDEVTDLLGDIRSAWRQLALDPPADVTGAPEPVGSVG